MSDGILCLGVDPGGFANIGLAQVRIPFDAARPLVVEWCSLLGTEPTKRKKTVRASSDMMDRGAIISRHLNAAFTRVRIAAVFTEGFSPLRSSMATAQQAWIFGEMTMITTLSSLPIFDIPPREVKRVLQAAGKAVVKDAVLRECVFTESVTAEIESIQESRRNHVYDAIGVVLAARSTNEVSSLLQMWKAAAQ